MLYISTLIHAFVFDRDGGKTVEIKYDIESQSHIFLKEKRGLNES